MPPKKKAEDEEGDAEGDKLVDSLVTEQQLQVEIALISERYNRWCALCPGHSSVSDCIDQ